MRSCLACETTSEPAGGAGGAVVGVRDARVVGTGAVTGLVEDALDVDVAGPDGVVAAAVVLEVCTFVIDGSESDSRPAGAAQATRVTDSPRANK